MAFYEDWCKGDFSWKTAIYWTVGILVIVSLVVGLTCAFVIVYPPKATADDAILQRFALTVAAAPTNASMSYNATATLSLRNPNWYRGINYDPIAVAFSYNGTRFDESGTVPAFYHKPKKTVTIRVTVGGFNKAVKLGAAGVAEFRAENMTRKFNVEVRLDTVMQYKGRKTRCPLVVICPLTLQLVDPDVAATAFQRIKCTVLRAKKSGC